MSSKRTTAASGIIGTILALSVIAVIALSGVSPVNLPVSTNSSPMTESTSQTEFPSGQSSTQTGASQTTVSASSPGQGVLSMLITDPPRVPADVTAVYITYGGLQVRGPQGWTTVKASGTVELMQTVGNALTLASSSLPTGSYDAVRFNVTSALVTYGGTNYTAVVQSGHLTVRIEGGVDVTGTQASATIIDFQPTVLNLGDASNPFFVIWSAARAFPVPAVLVSTTMEAEGHLFNISTLPWWNADESKAGAALQISDASLSANSLSFSVENTGSGNSTLRLVIIAQSQTALGTSSPYVVPSDMTGSAVFLILQNGTLVPFSPVLHIATPMIVGENGQTALSLLLQTGYNLTAGGSATFSYSGGIMLGYGLLVPATPITSGTSYVMTVIGNNAVASVIVTAA